MRRAIIILMMVILFSGIVSANFGVGFAKKISLKSGKSVERDFSIQNVLEGAEDLEIEISVKEGEEFIELDKKKYNVGAGEIVYARAKVFVPENVGEGEHRVSLLFEPVSKSPEREGTVQFSFGVGKGFILEVEGEQIVDEIVEEKVVEEEIEGENVVEEILRNPEVDDEVKEKSLLEKIIEWLRKLFGK